jgi:hypothetical protein
MATTAESLSGEGQVFVRETGEVIGRFPFRLRTYQRPGRVTWSTELAVDLDVESALRLLDHKARLVLRVPDGCLVDFQISGIHRLPHRVAVVANSGPHEDRQ